MPNPFAKGWNQLKASLDRTIDERADPKVLVHQAMTNAREQHKAVSDQAAAVIGNARQLEIQMGTTSRRIDEVQGQVRQALQLAESKRADGDDAGATRIEQQAESLAAQLVGLEQDLENTRGLHGQAVQAAEDAKRAVAESEQRLKETLAQEDKLLLQAEQAEMQQRTVGAMEGMSGPGGGNSPTFDEVRDKIEKRYTTALGRQELAEAQGAGTGSAAYEAAELTREAEGRARLDRIRQSMGLEQGSGTQPSLPRDTRGETGTASATDTTEGNDETDRTGGATAGH